MTIMYKNSNLFCSCCGSEFKIKYPINPNELHKKVKSFTELHNDCEPTYIEPKPETNSSAKEKAIFWLANGHTGLSSKTMFNCLMGNKGFEINYPHDPDDFSRCYKLLECVPEWKSELYQLKTLSKVWSNLVDNWNKLTEMYEQNTKENWKNYKQIGMYELMDKLISDGRKNV